MLHRSGRLASNQVRGGLFAASLSSLATTPVVCELSDTDGDHVFDDEDMCPVGSHKFRVNTVGCDVEQADSDRDGVCNFAMPDTTLCTGADNCPNVKNPLQTSTTTSTLGDACNLGTVHHA